MRSGSTLLMAAVALLAGCLGGTEGETPATPAATGGSTAAAGAPTVAETRAEPAWVYLAADGTMGGEPAAAGVVPYPEPINSPMASQEAVWTGTAPLAGNLSAEVPVRLFLTTNGAVVAARMIPPFALEQLPGLFIALTIGDAVWWADLAGPDFIHTGQVIEVTGVLTAEAPPVVAANATMELRIGAAYTHFRPVSELQFAVGPDQPAGFELAPR